MNALPVPLVPVRVAGYAPTPRPGVVLIDDENFLTCMCRNRPESSGFETVTPQGVPCEPTADWPGTYQCNDCGVLINISPAIAWVEGGEAR
ncbi:hypothetical protein [Microtetraspora malaysiensis]|uniref:Replication restart DNA helicase PriA n=1 Tax=Microtetraspora malaysiensis TaxID=161358 RepID=A0ABW6SKI8_9ACTN